MKSPDIAYVGDGAEVVQYACPPLDPARKLMRPDSTEFGIGWYLALTLSICFLIWLGVLFGKTAYYMGTGVIAAGCIAITFRQLQKARLIEDAPTSTIRAAAQGYVEVSGTATTASGIPLRSVLTGEPCCWRHLQIWRSKKNGEWALEGSSTSSDLIRLRDATGECLVNPKGAEITGTRFVERFGPTPDPADRRKPTKDSKYHFEETLLPEQAAVIVIGNLSSLSHDYPADMAGNATDMLSKPEDGRHLLISTFDHKALVGYYRRGATFTYKFTLAMLVAALAIELAGVGLSKLEPCPDSSDIRPGCLIGHMYHDFMRDL